MWFTWFRRVSGVALMIVSVVLMPAVAVAALLLVAAGTATVPVFTAAGAAALLACGAGLGRVSGRVSGLAGGARWGTAGGVAVACAWAVLAAATVLQPGPHPAAGPVPDGVRFWQLPTGSRIAYVHAGGTTGTPVLFLHGGPGTPGEGLPDIAGDLSSAGHPVYAYDQLGAGRSTRLADVTGYTVARQVADLEAIRVIIGSERVMLVGQSWGASLAAQYIAAHPEHVAAVVFTSPGPIWPGARPGGGTGDPWQRMTPAQRDARDALFSSPRVLAQALLQGVNPNAAHAFAGDDEADELMHRVAVLGKDGTGCPDSAPATVHGNHQGFYVNQQTVDDFARIADPRPALRRVRVPALVLRGDCDFVPADTAAEYQRTLPGATLVSVAGAGHAIARNQPERYRDLVTGFLAGVS